MKKFNRAGKTFASVVAGATVLAVFGTGTAVAGSMITSKNIKDNTIKSKDVRNNTLKSVDVRDGALTGADLQDFSLTNQDLGVLFAQINSDGTVANSSGGVTASAIDTGNYEVDFGRNISNCAATATVGTPNVGGARGVVSQLNERSNNPEALWVRTVDDADNLVDQNLPFQVIVVC